MFDLIHSLKFSNHALERMRQRRIHQSQILEIIRHGVSQDQPEGCTRFTIPEPVVGEPPPSPSHHALLGIHVVVDLEIPLVVTTWRDTKARLPHATLSTLIRKRFTFADCLAGAVLKRLAGKGGNNE